MGKLETHSESMYSMLGLEKFSWIPSAPSVIISSYYSSYKRWNAT